MTPRATPPEQATVVAEFCRELLADFTPHYFNEKQPVQIRMGGRDHFVIDALDLSILLSARDFALRLADEVLA